MESQLKQIVVIGAGVIGLTTAIKIQERGGYRVTVIAEALPGDLKTSKYTSPWAGAHHVSGAWGDPKQEKMDQDTFDIMWEMSKPGGEAEGCFLRIHQEDHFTVDFKDPNPARGLPDFKPLPKDSLLPNSLSGATFTTLTIDTQVYLPYLLARLLSRGGSIVRASIQHISQVVEGAFTSTRPDAVVVCAGLGARTLGGVEDKDVFPVRGQIVLLRAPWIKFGRTISNLSDDWTYIIPRRSGDIILGGTKIDNDWYPKARPETTIDILKRCIALAPELAPPGTTNPTYQDLLPLVIEDGCGFRPARKGGIRLEREIVGDTIIVYNYGHGGYGYQSSWGSASIALDLLET